MKDIRIASHRGIMHLDPDKFFPAAKRDIDKLLRVIQDPYTGEGDDKIQEIRENIDLRIRELRDKRKHYMDLHNDQCTDTEDFFDLMYLKHHGDICMKVYESITRTIGKLEKNLDYLRGL